MDGLISLLLFSGFFFLMMRYGCGAHISHGRKHRHHESKGDEAARIAKDPVCGMDVSTESPYRRKVEGREFRFCSSECLNKFEAHRDTYAA